jgi:SulP family sulfate permease
MSGRPDASSSSDHEVEVNLPGLGVLREAVANQARKLLPGPPSLRRDGLAGLSSAISNVPDGMANGIIVGVNPIYGLYAATLGPGIGGLVSSTRLMMITTTAAASLTTTRALVGLSAEARESALFAMVVLIGLFQILFGLLGLGRLVRFVSYSVMTGFLTGIAVLLLLSQLPTVAGYEARGDTKIAQTLDLLANLGQVDLTSLAVAVLALVLAVVLPRTPLGNLGRLAAVVVPSVGVALLGLESVQVVRDIGEIPRGLPMPALPSLSSMTFEVVTGAAAVAAIVLVQGAGVSQSVPNPDGQRRSTSRDFIAQGAANVASGLFRGLPVGGSMSATALNVVYGARTRWAAIFAGVWVAVILLAFPGPVSHIAMPTLGALLILAGASSIKPAEIEAVWDAGWPSIMAGAATFLATLFLPIQVAVGIGVVLSAVLYLYTSSSEVSVVELVERSDGRIEERRPAKQLASDRATVLDAYGHLFFAGARTFERLLPTPQDAKRPVVILRLRGRTTLGATLIDVLSNYTDKLEAVDGRLYLTGLSEAAYHHAIRTGKLSLSGPDRVYPATPILGESTRAALGDARAWLVSRGADPPADETPPDDAPPPDHIMQDATPRSSPQRAEHDRTP